jgi:hypothetical protein
MELLRRLDTALALIESMTDTVNDAEPAQEKIKRAIEMARSARWENGVLLTSYLYKDDVEESILNGFVITFKSGYFYVRHPSYPDISLLVVREMEDVEEYCTEKKFEEATKFLLEG